MARKSRYAVEVKESKQAAMTLAGIYTRLSVEDEEDEELNSIGNQKKIILDYLKDKDDISVVDYYSDNGYTGMNYNRPDFIRMMKDLRSGKINCVIVKDISRFGRHFVMTSEYVEKIFPMMDVRLICINDDYDSHGENYDSTALLMPIKMVMNDNYAKDISKKIRSSITAKIDNGTYLPSASSIPYGYVRNSEENTFDIDEDTAPVVVRIFEMKAAGMSLNAICDVLNEEEIPCPGKLRYIRGITKAEKYADASWIHGTVRKIILDQVYLGNRVHGRVKREKLGMDKTRRSEQEWTIIENAHRPIVSKELFDKAQAALHSRREKIKNYQKQENPASDKRKILKGKLYCGDCGNQMYSHKGLGRANERGERKAFVFYNCGKYTQSGKRVCSCHYIREKDVMKALQNTLDHQLKTVIDVERLIEEIRAMPKVTHYNEKTDNKLLSIQTKRRNMEQKLEQLMMDVTDGLLDLQEYTYAKNRYSEQLERLLEEENKAFAATKELGNLLTSTERWLRTLKAYHAMPEIDRKTVEYLVERINIYHDRRVEIILNYRDPYQMLRDFVDNLPEVVADAG